MALGRDAAAAAAVAAAIGALAATAAARYRRLGNGSYGI